MNSLKRNTLFLAMLDITSQFEVFGDYFFQVNSLLF